MAIVQLLLNSVNSLILLILIQKIKGYCPRPKNAFESQVTRILTINIYLNKLCNPVIRVIRDSEASMAMFVAGMFV